MALIRADRVKESSTSTGTGAFTLAGADSTYRTFASVCAVADTVYYAIAHRTSNEWEVGLGTYSGANTLTRTTVHASSNSGAAVNFSAGTKEVFLTLTAAQLNGILDTSGITDNPPNDGAQYTLACKKTSGTPSFYWVDSTGTIAPKLDLAFSATKSLTPYIGPTPSYSRASTGTYFNSSGVLTSAAINAPRFDHTYNGTSWVSKGLLVEAQGTNTILYSEDLTNATYNWGWSFATANQTTAPDGNLTADSLTEASGTGTHYIVQLKTIGAGTYTLSAFVKFPTSGVIRNVFLAPIFNSSLGNDKAVVFNSSGQFVGIVGSTGADPAYTVTNCGNGWFRFSVTATSTSFGNCYPSVGFADGTTLSYNGNGTSLLYIWGYQYENASFASSYIPSLSNSSTTRSADVCQITGSVFSGFWNGTEGSVAVEFDQLADATKMTNESYIYGFQNAADTEQFILRGQSNGVYYWRSVNSGNIEATAQISSLGTATVKHAACYKLNDFASTFNGAAVVSDTIGATPNPTALGIGFYYPTSSNRINGHIARLRYYPVRLPNATLQVLST